MRKIPQKLQEWIDARKRYRLSDAHIQMARELGMKPSSLGKMTPNKDQKWKIPLADFIEHLYEKRFKRSVPAEVISIEKLAERQAKTKQQNDKTEE